MTISLLIKWITREKVKVDRVACLWVIKKFIDPEAEFVFVPADQVSAKSLELGATPYDIEGCELGHHGESSNGLSRTKACGSSRLSTPIIAREERCLPWLLQQLGRSSILVHHYLE